MEKMWTSFVGDSKGGEGDGNGDSKSGGRKPRRERRDEGGSKAEEQPSPSDGKARRKRDTTAGAGEADDAQMAGGWMSTSTTSTSAMRRAKQAIQQPEEEEEEEEPEKARFNPANQNKHFQDTDDVMIIPDLEDDGESDQRVAHAPRNFFRKIPTLAELESDVKSAVPKAEGGLDLSILLSVLVPPSQLVDPDTTWTFDSLLREVTDELTGIEKTVTQTITKEAAGSNGSKIPGSPGSPTAVAAASGSKHKLTGEKRKS